MSETLPDDADPGGRRLRALEASRRALLDAKSWFGSAASWVGNALGDILKSEAAQKTIGTVTEASTRATIDSFLK